LQWFEAGGEGRGAP